MSEGSSGEKPIFSTLFSEHNLKCAPNKLAIYEVLASKTIFYTSLSKNARLTCQRVLAAGTHSIPRHPDSNLKALGFIVLASIFHPHSAGHFTIKQTLAQLGELQASHLPLQAYPFSNRFQPSDYLSMVGSMFSKIVDLIAQELDIFEIVDVYASYLELMSFFLRAILLKISFPQADNFNTTLSTVNTYAVLTDLLDINCYVKNGSLFMFPDHHIFVAVEEKEEFVFGRYYDNVDDLKQSEKFIRESTLEYLKKENQKYDSMKISKASLSASVSGFDPFSETVKESNVFTSKAPTPEFGDLQLMGFDGIIEKDDDDTPTPSSKALENCQAIVTKSAFMEENTEKSPFEQFHNYNLILQTERIHEQEEQLDGEEPNSPVSPIKKLENSSDVFSPYSENVVHYIGNPEKNNDFMKEPLVKGPSFNKVGSERVLNKGSSTFPQKTSFKKTKTQEKSPLRKNQKSEAIKIVSSVYSFNFTEAWKESVKKSGQQAPIQSAHETNQNSKTSPQNQKENQENKKSKSKSERSWKSGRRLIKNLGNKIVLNSELHPNGLKRICKRAQQKAIANPEEQNKSNSKSKSNSFSKEKPKELQKGRKSSYSFSKHSICREKKSPALDVSWKKDESSLSRSGHGTFNRKMMEEKVRNSHIPEFLKKRSPKYSPLPHDSNLLNAEKERSKKQSETMMTNIHKRISEIKKSLSKQKGKVKEIKIKSMRGSHMPMGVRSTDKLHVESKPNMKKVQYRSGFYYQGQACLHSGVPCQVLHHFKK